MGKYRNNQSNTQRSKLKHISTNKRDGNNNIIYYESLSSYGYVIKHYQRFDNLNRKIHYSDTTGVSNDITYWDNTNKLKQEKEIYINRQGIKSFRVINYNQYGCISNRLIISGNYTTYNDFDNPNNNYVNFSPYFKVIE